MKKLSILLLLLAACTTSSWGQTNLAIEAYNENLIEATGHGGASINVKHSSSVNSALAGLKGGVSRINGMHVCVFFDNSQIARSGASSALGRLKATCPGIRAWVVYQNPFFKVMAGDCIDKLEATRLLGVLKPHFPGAIIVNNTITMAAAISGGENLTSEALLKATPDNSYSDDSSAPSPEDGPEGLSGESITL